MPTKVHAARQRRVAVSASAATPSPVAEKLKGTNIFIVRITVYSLSCYTFLRAHVTCERKRLQSP